VAAYNTVVRASPESACFLLSPCAFKKNSFAVEARQKLGERIAVAKLAASSPKAKAETLMYINHYQGLNKTKETVPRVSQGKKSVVDAHGFIPSTSASDPFFLSG
jgi:hypothetical protein